MSLTRLAVQYLNEMTSEATYSCSMAMCAEWRMKDCLESHRMVKWQAQLIQAAPEMSGMMSFCLTFNV